MIKEEEESIINNSRSWHDYVTVVITHNYKVIENLKKNPKLINSDIDKDDTLEIWQTKPYNLFIKSRVKPYILASNQYVNGCLSGSPIYLITTDNSSIISNVTIE